MCNKVHLVAAAHVWKYACTCLAAYLGRQISLNVQHVEARECEPRPVGAPAVRNELRRQVSVDKGDAVAMRREGCHHDC